MRKRGGAALIEILNGTKETVAYREHFGIRLYLNREAEDYPVHWHTAGEIIMPTDNRYTVIVDDTSYELSPGDILVLPPGELHELKSPDSGERIILQFDCSLLYNLKGFDSTFHLLRPCCLITSEHDGELHRTLRTLLLELKDEYFGQSLLKEAAAYAKLIGFFVELGRNAVHAEHSRGEQKKSRKYRQNIDTFLKVCHYMNEHCTEDIQAEELARLAGFSKFHFTRLFKQYIGMSYYDYLGQHRIMHAEKLLIDPNLSVTEVAMRSGFGSLATFNRAFKAFKKCTPTQYKALHDNGGAGRDPGSGAAK
ncbi:AraC family transcriptional regulator [Cohnella caldifontis]|uniref:AraC family transcriptional regulator n=1 Tax=Cohnella caldifontis TaxID=3027471 RepID=UPI0023EB5CDF|nr:AraC family transcriptional regulator [Cohnella sp. YIM B05605]